jgi:hypothetical protein
VRTGDELLLLPEQRRRLPQAESSRKRSGLLMSLLLSAAIQGTLQGRRILFSILRLGWLAANAAYLSCTQDDGFDCHGCTKADFFTYYPVKWVFYTGNPLSCCC